jgi:hypothetical protein
MPRDIDPILLFALVAMLAGVLAVQLWRPNRGVAVVAAGLAGCSGLLVWNERVSRAAGANIRVDLLVTIPVIAVAAIVVGAFSMRRPPVRARIVGAGILAIGGVMFAGFSWKAVKTSFEIQGLNKAFEQGHRLYWEETIRCAGNMAKRFGPIEQTDRACRGNLVVTSRGAKTYPFSRAIVNDDGQFYLLRGGERGAEETWGLDSIDSDRPAARLEGNGGVLAGDGTKDGKRVHVELRSEGSGACAATIQYGAENYELVLVQKEIPPCQPLASPQVRFVGAWGIVAPYPNSPRTRRLVQIWLWDTGGSARGLFLGNLGTSGMEIPFMFARQLKGTRRAENQWELRFAGKGDDASKDGFSFMLADGKARVAGPATLFGPAGEMMLDPQEVVSHPKIALAPVLDGSRFAAYFDNVFFNLNVPWTVP